jgi:hypothetical protein
MHYNFVVIYTPTYVSTIHMWTNYYSGCVVCVYILW